jgi:5,10-methylenetetrahydromethanopterin reductase
VKTGVVLQGVDTPNEFTALVDLIEGLGYDYLWLTDSSLHTRNCWSYLTLAAMRTARLTLGTAVTNPVTRHPGITAAAAATLDEVSEGRFVLGVGAGDRPLQALDIEPARLGTLRRSVEAFRRLFAGETIDLQDSRFAFHHAHMRFPARADIPVWISASGEQTLRYAGGHADGVVLLCGLFHEGVAWAIERIDEGANAAGRPRPHIGVFAYGAIDDEDPERALDAARSIAAWFPMTAPVYCDLAGLDPAIANAVRERYTGGEFQEAAAAARLLPDDFVRGMALAGGSDEAVRHLKTLAELGVDSVNVFPLGPARRQTIEAFAKLANADPVEAPA